MFSFLKKIVFTAVAVALILFLYQNMEHLSQTISFGVDLYVEDMSYTTPEFPVFFMFLAAFLLGTMVTGLQGIYERIARKAEARTRNRRIKALEKEVSELKSQLRKPEPIPTLTDAGDKEEEKPVETAAALVASEPEPKKIAQAPATVEKKEEKKEEPAYKPLEEEPTL